MGAGVHDRRCTVACTPSVNPDAEPELLYLHALFALKDAKLGIIESAAPRLRPFPLVPWLQRTLATAHAERTPPRAWARRALPRRGRGNRLPSGRWPPKLVRTPRLVPR